MRGPLETNKCKTRFRVDLFLKVFGAFDNHDLAGRTNGRAHQVTAVRCSVLSSDDEMRMNLRLAIFQSDISDQ